MRPAALFKILSLATDVAGILRYYLATLATEDVLLGLTPTNDMGCFSHLIYEKQLADC